MTTEQQQLSDDEKELMIVENTSWGLLESLTPSQRIKLFSNTLKNFVKERPGRGNQVVKYVQGWYIKQVMNLVFDYKWGNTITGHTITPDEVIVWGTVSADFGNHDIHTQSSFGESQIHYYKCDKIKSVQVACQKDKSICKIHTCEQIVSIGDDLKAAHTDMIKKAANIWGIAMDVYQKRMED
jgi:hypothetical protein